MTPVELDEAVKNLAALSDTMLAESDPTEPPREVAQVILATFEEGWGPESDIALAWARQYIKHR